MGSVAVPGVLLVLTTLYLVDVMGLGAPLDGRIPTPAFFPLVLVGLMYGALGMVLWKAFRRVGDQVDDEPEAAANAKTPILVFLTISLYVLAFAYLGYVVTTPIFVYAMLHLFEFGDPRTIPGQAKRVAAAIALTAIVYTFFVAGFSVRLPGVGS